MMNKTIFNSATIFLAYVSTPHGAFIKAPVDTTLNQVSLCYYISGSEKRIGASKGATHPEAERIAMKEVKTRWESGNPVTRPEVYNLLRNSYDPSTSFHKLLGSVASIHMMKGGKCFLLTWRL